MLSLPPSPPAWCLHSDSYTANALCSIYDKFGYEAGILTTCLYDAATRIYHIKTAHVPGHTPFTVTLKIHDEFHYHICYTPAGCTELIDSLGGAEPGQYFGDNIYRTRCCHALAFFCGENRCWGLICTRCQLPVLEVGMPICKHIPTDCCDAVGIEPCLSKLQDGT